MFFSFCRLAADLPLVHYELHHQLPPAVCPTTMRAFNILISALVAVRCAAFVPSSGARTASSFARAGPAVLKGGRSRLPTMTRRARPQHQREEVRAMRGGGMAGGAPQQYDGA